jgi:hypothetical protein
MTISVKKKPRTLDNFHAILNRSTGSGHWAKKKTNKQTNKQKNPRKLNTVTSQVTAI